MLNKVMLIGNVGQNPEIKTLPSGGLVANFSLATTEYWKGKDGEKQSKTEWHRITVYLEGLVKLSEKHIHKGSKVYIEGSLRSRQYTDSQGVKRTSVEIVIQSYGDTIKLLDSKQNSYGNERSEKTEDDDHVEESQIGDDEIPF